MKHTIPVRLPNPCLSPNARVHWAKLATAKKNYRAIVCNVIRIMHAEIVDARWDRATIQYAFHHKTNRNRDDDNLIAMMKSARDAFEDAGVVVNDCGFTTLPVVRKIDKSNPRVEITIEKTEK